MDNPSLDDINKIITDSYVKGVVKGSTFKSKFGFATAASGRYSRSNLYGFILKNSIKQSGSKINDSTIVEQLLSLEVKKGRVDHSSGGHDDVLFAYLLAQWFLQQANNKKLYGFDTGSILIDTSSESDIDKN